MFFIRAAVTLLTINGLSFVLIQKKQKTEQSELINTIENKLRLIIKAEPLFLSGAKKFYFPCAEQLTLPLWARFKQFCSNCIPSNQNFDLIRKSAYAVPYSKPTILYKADYKNTSDFSKKH